MWALTHEVNGKIIRQPPFSLRVEIANKSFNVEIDYDIDGNGRLLIDGIEVSNEDDLILTLNDAVKTLTATNRVKS